MIINGSKNNNNKYNKKNQYQSMIKNYRKIKYTKNIIINQY